MKKTNRLLSVLLVLLLLCTSIPIAFAASGVCGENLTWMLNDGTLTVSGLGTMYDFSYDDSDLQIPWNGWQHSIKKVIIEDGVTSIGNHAFSNCVITSMTIPNSVTRIGEFAFSGCSNLASLAIGNNVTEIEDYAFYQNYGLTSLSLGDNVKSIGVCAFEKCYGLVSVRIPNSVTSIASSAFADCKNLEAFTVDSLNPVYSSDSSGVLYNKAKTELIKYPGGKQEKDYDIPSSVERIGSRSFSSNWFIETVTMHDNVKSIETQAFWSCESLHKITLSKNIKSIENATFGHTSLSEIVIPDGVVSIGYRAFFECFDLNSVTIGKDVNTISRSAFEYCKSLKTIFLASSVNAIERAAFVDCPITEVFFEGTEEQWNEISIAAGNTSLTNAIIHYNYNPNPVFSHTVTYNYTQNGGSSATMTSATVNEGASIDLTPTATKSGWTFVGWNTNPNATTALSSLTMGTGDVTLYAIFKKDVNIYNLGEETYSFRNYSDGDSPDGHCFGMAVTSSGYYMGTLSKSIIGASDQTALYSFPDSASVRKPICYYLRIQGPGPEFESIVAGGNYERTGDKNINADWSSCVSYVKGHQYDNKGSLNIGMWFLQGGGHAVNFLYYKEVNGQQRIYAYDNNLPTKEVYYYLGADGYVHREPNDGWTIDSLDLMDVNHYFQLAPSFKLNRYIYAQDGDILVEGAQKYYMKCGTIESRSVMYEIPDSVTEVTVKPLVEKAGFQYYGADYAFGEINENTKGTLKVLSKTSTEGERASFTIQNAPASQQDEPQPENLCPWCGGEHTGFFGGIVGFFHRIFAAIFGARY